MPCEFMILVLCVPVDAMVVCIRLGSERAGGEDTELILLKDDDDDDDDEDEDEDEDDDDDDESDGLLVSLNEVELLILILCFSLNANNILFISSSCRALQEVL